ncbi:MAG: BlaI/MecI/CopY family transcriptional regulator [Oscillospiraceae bacterium]|nr:BlaI/MecI/CopY family transcriptional regulator [Oscillospiraceae bacterium]
MDNYKLFDAEYRLMSIVWENEPINSTQLSKLCLNELGWKKSTVYNMVKKLSERNFLKNENAIVTSLVNQEKVKKYESEVIVENKFNGSLPAFIAAFLSDKKITEKEAEEIRRMIDNAEE